MQLDKVSEEHARELVQNINPRIDDFAEMTFGERLFLTQLILQAKPKKILELGVSAGGSSVLILNAIQELPKTDFHSVEYSATWWQGSNLPSGFLIEKRFPAWRARWNLHMPGTAADFMHEIGGDIDFCLIDTVHLLPGEILDFLIVLPYLAPKAIIVLHDIALQTAAPLCFSNILLFQALRGERWMPHETDREGFPYPNIGAVRLAQDQELGDLFRLLTLPWLHYLPTARDLSKMRELFAKNYSSEMLGLFDCACASNSKMWRSPFFTCKRLKSAMRLPLINLARKIGVGKNKRI